MDHGPWLDISCTEGSNWQVLFRILFTWTRKKNQWVKSKIKFLNHVPRRRQNFKM
jgi:hypothetical protein